MGVCCYDGKKESALGVLMLVKMELAKTFRF